MINWSTVINDYYTLCKPRVVALMVLTAIVAMMLAAPINQIPWRIVCFASLGISCAASAGATLNHLIDARIDIIMSRTKKRPIPAGRVLPAHAIIFAGVLTVIGMLILIYLVNWPTALLTFLTLIGYAGIYTLFLKRATPQNIVIGGLAGAMPPLIGWTAIVGHIDAKGLLLALIIFVWTPPHFWALAIDRCQEYAKADIPMLPVTHGVEFTRLNILLYSVLLAVITYMPFVIDMTGLIYLLGATGLNIIFLYYAVRVYLNDKPKIALSMFRFSIIYLALLFIVLLVDHYYPLLT